MTSEQGYEAADEERFLFSGVGTLGNAQQILLFGAANGNDEAAAFSELFDEGRGHGGSRSGNDDCVVGRAGRPTERTVVFLDADVRVAEANETFATSTTEFRLQFNGDNFLREQGEDGRLITGARADFENSFRAIELGGVGHGRYHEGLRDGLSTTDGKRRIGIGSGGRFGRNEFVARDGEHRVEDARRADPASADLADDHFVAGGGKVAGG